jgi:hypothetical protein
MAKLEWVSILKDNISLVNGVEYEKLYNLIEAQHRCKLTGVLLGSGIDIIKRFHTEIPEGAFFQSDLETAELRNTINKIGQLSFGRCKKLKRLVIPTSVTYIDDKAFLGTSSLQEIIYLGPMDQWEEVVKNFDLRWDTGSYFKKIICGDGEISHG